MSRYRVEIISKDMKDKLMFGIYSEEMYERKANIHGTCVKLFTDSNGFKDMWEENFEPMPDTIRPHARVFAVKGGKKFRVLYEPESKTVIIYNCNYYGWVKSIALALVAEFFEDFTSEHRRYSVHGSFVDYGGRGIAIIGPSGSGKTTLTYGLLLEDKFNFLTDDWFFVRMKGDYISVYSSERNSYIRNDLAENWPELRRRIKCAVNDNKGRAVVDIKRVFGSERIMHKSNLEKVVLLTRDKKLGYIIKKLGRKEAMDFLLKNDFCNPHQLVRGRKKLSFRKKFFEELYSRVPFYMLNTIETPKESLERVKAIIEK